VAVASVHDSALAVGLAFVDVVAEAPRLAVALGGDWGADCRDDLFGEPRQLIFAFRPRG
jgi:hypothetical protein